MLRILSLGAGVQRDLSPETELAWAAGFFDGEGNTRIEASLDGRRKYIRMSIGQIDQEPLVRFQNAVDVGTIYGPYLKQRNNVACLPIWTYSARGKSAKIALQAIYPYLSGPKQRQAADALAGEVLGRGLDHCKLKTHCPQGHPYDENNTYVDKRGYRHCKTCWRERDKRGRPWRYSGS